MTKIPPQPGCSCELCMARRNCNHGWNVPQIHRVRIMEPAEMSHRASGKQVLTHFTDALMVADAWVNLGARVVVIQVKDTCGPWHDVCGYGPGFQEPVGRAAHAHV